MTFGPTTLTPTDPFRNHALTAHRRSCPVPVAQARFWCVGDGSTDVIPFTHHKVTFPVDTPRRCIVPSLHNTAPSLHPPHSAPLALTIATARAIVRPCRIVSESGIGSYRNGLWRWYVPARSRPFTTARTVSLRPNRPPPPSPPVRTVPELYRRAGGRCTESASSIHHMVTFPDARRRPNSVRSHTAATAALRPSPAPCHDCPHPDRCRGVYSDAEDRGTATQCEDHTVSSI